MAENQTSTGNGEKLFTLSEVSRRTKISMPTLLRYKREHQDRIPAQGSGRTQRFPESALAVFQQLKQESLGRRGRPRKEGNGKRTARPRGRAARRGRPPGRPAKGRRRTAPSAGGEGLLTLTEIARTTGISYPTLQKYTREHLGKLPHEGKGRRRRFRPEAVEVFQRLRGESRRGRPPAAAATGKRRGRPPGSGVAAGGTNRTVLQALQRLERSHAALEKQLRAVVEELRRPMKMTLSR